MANNTSFDGDVDEEPVSGSADVDPAHWLPGRLIADRYQVDDVVSSGANTIVCEAIDVRTGDPVTLKIVRTEFVQIPGFREKFEACAQASSTLVHPNVASILEWGDLDLAGEPCVYWTCEYLSGGSLRDHFDRGRFLTPSQALVVGLEAARGLEAAHARGIAHTELTPSKLVFGDDRRLRVIDFGMAHLLGSAVWEDPSHVPTHVARYASPEQALGSDVDERTDIYSLSLILIEGVTESVPFAADSTVATLSARVGKLMPVSADLGSLAAVLERAGRTEAADRYTAPQLAQAFVDAAPKLPRPEPIEVLSGSLFAAAERLDAATPAPIPDVPVVEPVVVEDVEVVEVVDDVTTPIDRTEQMPVMATTAMAVTAVPTNAAAEPTQAIYDDERRPRRWPKVAAVLLVTLAVLAGLAFAGWWLLRTKSYEVPDLSGVNEDVAQNEIGGNDWVVETEPGRSDEFSIPGTVISTDPGPGVMLDEGETFVMVVSEGPEFRVLPEFADQTIEAAVATLTELSLNGVETPERVYSEDVPPGTVVSWEVDGDASLVEGSEVLPGRTVVLTVSKGPEPRPTPQLVGQTVEAATATLDDLKLVLVVGDPVFSDDFEAGLVALQSPAPETLVERGGAVTVQVSKGIEMLPIPSLEGLTYPQATKALTDGGFVVGDLLGTTEGTFVSMSVDGEDVEPGDMFRRGTVVDLIFL